MFLRFCQILGISSGRFRVCSKCVQSVFWGMDHVLVVVLALTVGVFRELDLKHEGFFSLFSPSPWSFQLGPCPLLRNQTQIPVLACFANLSCRVSTRLRISAFFFSFTWDRKMYLELDSKRSKSAHERVLRKCVFCVFSCPGQLNSDGDLDWTDSKFLRCLCF